MAITDEVLNELLRDYQKPEDLLGQHGLLKQLQKRLLEKAMGAELTVHLGYDKHDAIGRNSGNSRTPRTLSQASLILQGEGRLKLTEQSNSLSQRYLRKSARFPRFSESAQDHASLLTSANRRIHEETSDG